MMKKKIAIFCGGPSSEHEVSILSATKIFELIDRTSYDVSVFYISKDLKCSILLDIDDIQKSKPTLSLMDGLTTLKKEGCFCFLAGTHGEFMEDGRIQTILDYFGLFYSGTGASGSFLAMDKYRSSLIAKTIDGVLIPKTILIKKGENIPPTVFFPCVLKPNRLGSSVGVAIVKNNKEYKSSINSLRKEFPDEDILIQEYISGIEITCGVLERKNKKTLLLPPIEIVPQINTFFDYNSKYVVGGSKEITPPVSIDKDFSNKISEIAAKIHKLLDLKTYSRSDFMIDGEKIYYLETNTLPGMTATSLIPQEANAIGISYAQLLDFLIENA